MAVAPVLERKINFERESEYEEEMRVSVKIGRAHV